MLKYQKTYHSLNFTLKNIKKKKLNSIIFFPTSETKLLGQITTSFEFNVAITGELSKLNINVARGDQPRKKRTSGCKIYIYNLSLLSK